MRIVVTGGAGFIGSHIVNELVSVGHDVAVIDNLWIHGGGRRENVDARASFVYLDIRDPDLKRFFGEFKPEIVCHHAAQHSVAIGSRDPQFDASINIGGLLNVLDAAVESGVRKIIFASSAATYGDLDRLPADENSPQRPLSPYGITKMSAEHYLRFYQKEHGLDFTAFRYGNVYGPRQDPNGEAGVIAVFVGRFISGEGVRIDWDGEQTRDYVYVGDVARANLAAVNAGSGEVYVIGTGKKTSVNDIYGALCQISGVSVPITRGPRRSGDVREVYFNVSKARRELGWRPEMPLAEGIRATFGYFSQKAEVVHS